MGLIQNDALEPIVVGHDLCDLQKRWSDYPLDPVDAALRACFANFGCSFNLGCKLTIAQQMACRICTSEILCAGHDGIPWDDSIDVAKLYFCAQPTAFHHCELMPLFVATKELSRFALAYLKSARMAYDSFNIEP